MTRRTWARGLLVLLLAAPIAAQQPRPRFEAASVRPVPDGPVSMAGLADVMPRARPGGLFNPTRTTVESLVLFAYGLKPYQLVGGPEWARRDLFQINATAGRDAPAEEIRLMVRSLLEERFRLVVRAEPRAMRYQALVRARPDGALGPGLFGMDECSPAIVNELRRTFPERYPLPGGGTIGGCSRSGVDSLADLLSFGLRTPVIDATGLQGSYYHTIRSQFSPIAELGLGKRESNPDLPALSTALDEQLGLMLESRRGPIDVLVIESVEQPTEN